MENLNLPDAFARYGGKTTHRLHTRSAIAADGALILSCATPYFSHPARGVLRYEDKLSRETPGDTALLGEHLGLARDGSLPIRMVVIKTKPEADGKTSRNIHVRADLVGKVTSFDGDHFVVDFIRTVNPHAPPPKRK